jgi:purine-binding chemotaxis protein CheW
MTTPDTTGEDLMLCAIETGGFSFGIDTRRIREVLGVTPVQKVPLAPHFISGMVSYRGEVLTTVSLRALLAMPPYECESCLLVLDGLMRRNGEAEQFGLMVDRVGGVVAVGEDLLANNPPPIAEWLRCLFQAAYRGRTGLIVQLNPEQMRPEKLMLPETVRFESKLNKEGFCEH